MDDPLVNIIEPIETFPGTTARDTKLMGAKRKQELRRFYELANNGIDPGLSPWSYHHQSVIHKAQSI